MRFSTQLEKFRKFFQIAQKVIAVNDIRPVLQALKVSVEGETATIVGTDMDNVIRMKFDCDVYEEGSVMVPAKLVTKLLALSDDDVVGFQTDETHLTIKGDRSTFILPVIDGSEFPDFEDFNFDKCHEVNPNDLACAFERTQFAIDKDNSKFALAGVCVCCRSDELSTVATDGRRMANQEINASVVDGHCTEPNNTIISIKTIGILKSMLAISDSTVDVKVENEKIFFRVGNMELSARLIAGRFPKWENIIPNLKDRVRVDMMAGSLLMALKQAQVVTTDVQPGVFLKFSQGKLNISASAEKGNSSVELPIAYDGEDFEIKLDPEYLIQGVACLPKDDIISVWLKEKQSLFLTDSVGFKYVLMPLS